MASRLGLFDQVAGDPPAAPGERLGAVGEVLRGSGGLDVWHVMGIDYSG